MEQKRSTFQQNKQNEPQQTPSSLKRNSKYSNLLYKSTVKQEHNQIVDPAEGSFRKKDNTNQSRTTYSMFMSNWFLRRPLTGQYTQHGGRERGGERGRKSALGLGRKMKMAGGKGRGRQPRAEGKKGNTGRKKDRTNKREQRKV